MTDKRGQETVGPDGEGLVSVDGAWFDLARGTWIARSSESLRPLRSEHAGVSGIADGYVSVDGALLRIDPS